MDEITSLEKALDETQNMPYEQFPMYVMMEGNPEQSALINQYLRLGYEAKQSVPALLDKIKVLVDALQEIDHDSQVEDNPSLCELHFGATARKALQRYASSSDDTP
jgi:hypothetical protein